ncbi:MAG: hypothetical protein GY913_08275 [Proteobacteria bacterium]|nr:hypothetical protein [Pseudomonadota bacterium]MCP4916906.1 hypothetical protein [Pseudomonadota bacterium]
MIAWLVACMTSSPTAEPTTSIASCQAYSGEALSWCLVREVPDLDDVGLCTDATPFEAECRLRWVRRHQTRVPVDELLAACLTDEECRFDVIDGSPAGFLDQLDRCAQLGDTAPFCQEHAALRWLDAGAPDLDAVVQATTWPEARGRALGHVHACSEGPACDTLAAELQGPCRTLADEVEADRSVCSR